MFCGLSWSWSPERSGAPGPCRFWAVDPENPFDDRVESGAQFESRMMRKSHGVVDWFRLERCAFSPKNGAVLIAWQSSSGPRSTSGKRPGLGCHSSDEDTIPTDIGSRIWKAIYRIRFYRVSVTALATCYISESSSGTLAQRFSLPRGWVAT
jgi:hypothetical protein